jgi:hypothetical protein
MQNYDNNNPHTIAAEINLIEFVKNLKTNKEYSPKGVLVINVNEVVELA